MGLNVIDGFEMTNVNLNFTSRKVVHFSRADLNSSDFELWDTNKHLHFRR